jgi:hypothetical protein
METATNVVGDVLTADLPATQPALLKVVQTVNSVTHKNYQTASGSSVDINISHCKATDYYAKNLPLTGYTVWFGAHNLVDYAAAHLDDFKHVNVLELGSGVGLCGIAVAALIRESGGSSSSITSSSNSPPSMVLTDGERELLPILRQNCIDNGISASCEHLWWGDFEATQALLLRYPEGFAQILGADLIYSPSQQSVASLMGTVTQLLARNFEARFCMAVTRRNFGIEEILEIAAKFGLTWELDEDTIYDIFDNNNAEQTVFWRDSIYVFRRDPAATTPPPTPTTEETTATTAAKAEIATAKAEADMATARETAMAAAQHQQQKQQ